MTSRTSNKSHTGSEQAIENLDANQSAKAEFNTVKLFCQIMKKAEEAAQAA